MRKTVGSRIISLVLSVLMAFAVASFAGCSSNKGDNELWFVYFKGGYGSEWATQLAAKFEEEHPGVKVTPIANSQLIDDVPNYMENGCDYDLIFCHDVAWEDFVYPEWIYCLDDLYNTEVSDGVTFKDRIWDDDVLDSCSYVGRDGKNHYYKVPWTIGTAGIAYNLTIMDRVDAYFATSKGQTYLATAEGGSDVTRKWNRKAPETYYDLWQYCNDVINAKLLAVEDDTTSDLVKPFTWSGKSEEWQWDYAVFDWWGQLAGPETMNTFKNFGNVDENYNLDWDSVKNPDINVYNPKKAAVVRNDDGTVNEQESTHVGWHEFKQAYSLWYDLIVDNKNWSLDKIASFAKYENESAFAYGQAAMTPAACWIEYESKTYLEAAGQEVSIMASPIISHVRFDNNGKVIPKYDTARYNASTDEIDAIHATAEDVASGKKTIKQIGDEYYNRVSFTSSFGDSVMIPQSASNKELAVEFILFMQKEENAKLFTKLSGGTVLPYKYDYASSFVDSDGVDKATAWQKSVFEINANSTKFNNYTKHPMMRNTQLKKTARMEAMWPQNEYYYYKAWANNTSGTYKADALFDSIYGSLSPLWEQWKNSYKNNY